MSDQDPNTTQNKSPGELVEFVENIKRQWMATIDAMVDPLMIVSKDFKIKKANKAMAKRVDLEVKDVVGMTCHKVFAGSDTPCEGCSMHKTVEGGQDTSFELDGVDGERFFEVSSHPVQDAGGSGYEAVQIYRDRTSHRRMQEQLLQQEKLASIGLLAGGVAHEINNPLGGILIFSQMLLREMDKKSPHYQDVVEIESATQRCKAIVESLLDFARQQPGNTTSKDEEVDVLEAARTAIRFGKVGMQQQDSINLEEHFDDTMHAITADRNKLTQLFLNLVQNAIQAMPNGGTLIVRSHLQNRGGNAWGVYEIEDTGIGMPPEVMKKVFDPFFTTKDPGEGTGLGLALCYSIVQDLGGGMNVESTVNVGTRFRIELPLNGAAANQTAS